MIHSFTFVASMPLGDTRFEYCVMCTNMILSISFQNWKLVKPSRLDLHSIHSTPLIRPSDRPLSQHTRARLRSCDSQNENPSEFTFLRENEAFLLPNRDTLTLKNDTINGGWN